MNTLLNGEKAKKIFSAENEGAHAFMRKGGAKISSSDSLGVADPQKSFVANKATLKGWMLSSTGNMPSTNSPAAKYLYDTKEISRGGMDNIEPMHVEKVIEQDNKISMVCANASRSY